MTTTRGTARRAQKASKAHRETGATQDLQAETVQTVQKAHPDLPAHPVLAETLLLNMTHLKAETVDQGQWALWDQEALQVPLDLLVLKDSKAFLVSPASLVRLVL